MALLDESAKGVYVIAVTPFTDDGALDLESTDRMVDFYLEKGATGLTVLGMMGEAPKLTAAESEHVREASPGAGRWTRPGGCGRVGSRALHPCAS